MYYVTMHLEIDSPAMKYNESPNESECGFQRTETTALRQPTSSGSATLYRYAAERDHET